MDINRTQMLDMFRGIQKSFPRLKMELMEHHPHVDMMLDIPEQPGLLFAVNLNLQGDELHLSARSFWLEWFPCTDLSVVEGYRNAVMGLLSGRYRILEKFLWDHPVGGELQRPEGKGWKTIGKSSTSSIGLIPWPRKCKPFQNVSDNTSV